MFNKSKRQQYYIQNHGLNTLKIILYIEINVAEIEHPMLKIILEDNAINEELGYKAVISYIQFTEFQ